MLEASVAKEEAAAAPEVPQVMVEAAAAVKREPAGVAVVPWEMAGSASEAPSSSVAAGEDARPSSASS